MADNVPITPGSGKDIATDDVASVHYQKIKVDLGGDGVSSPLVRGQQTKANSIPVTHASDDTVALATGSKVQLTDGTTDATVRNLAANDALNVAIVDGSGNHITSIGGTGGTSATDDADFTPLSTTGTPVMAVYESAPTSVTDNDMGIIGIDQNRRVKVSVDASTLDVAHDAADSGNPVKTGAKALSAMPAAVAANDRANNVSDLYGRQLVSHIDPGMFVTKQVEATSTQTGTTIWDPTSGKKIAVTGYQIGTGGTTAALVTIWFGDNADVTFTQGTDQVLFRGTLTPTATSTPGVISNLASPVFCTTADRELHYTTSAGITIYITIYGYEY
jgi:hypothetical protein